MDLFTAVFGGGLLALFTAIQFWINRGRFDAIDRRFDAIDRRFEAIDRRFEAVDRRLDQLATEIAQLRSDLLQVVLALKPQQQTG